MLTLWWPLKDAELCNEGNVSADVASSVVLSERPEEREGVMWALLGGRLTCKDAILIGAADVKQLWGKAGGGAGMCAFGICCSGQCGDTSSGNKDKDCCNVTGWACRSLGDRQPMDPVTPAGNLESHYLDVLELLACVFLDQSTLGWFFFFFFFGPPH